MSFWYWFAPSRIAVRIVSCFLFSGRLFVFASVARIFSCGLCFALLRGFSCTVGMYSFSMLLIRLENCGLVMMLKNISLVKPCLLSASLSSRGSSCSWLA